MNMRSVASRIARGTQIITVVVAAVVVVLVVAKNLQIGQAISERPTPPTSAGPPERASNGGLVGTTEPRDSNPLSGQVHELQASIQKAIDGLTQEPRAEAWPTRLRDEIEEQIAQHQQVVDDLKSQGLTSRSAIRRLLS